MEKKNNPKIVKDNQNGPKKSFILDLDQRSKQIFRLIVNDFLQGEKSASRYTASLSNAANSYEGFNALIHDSTDLSGIQTTPQITVPKSYPTESIRSATRL